MGISGYKNLLFTSWTLCLWMYVAIDECLICFVTQMCVADMLVGSYNASLTDLKLIMGIYRKITNSLLILQNNHFFESKQPFSLMNGMPLMKILFHNLTG